MIERFPTGGHSCTIAGVFSAISFLSRTPKSEVRKGEPFFALDSVTCGTNMGPTQITRIVQRNWINT